MLLSSVFNGHDEPAAKKASVYLKMKKIEKGEKKGTPRPAVLISVEEMKDKFYTENWTKPYYLVAQVSVRGRHCILYYLSFDTEHETTCISWNAGAVQLASYGLLVSKNLVENLTINSIT
jgi:hypothetical protein